MGADNITINYLGKPEFPKQPYSAPKRRFTTTWIKSDLGFFRVDITIVGPVTEKPKDYIPLNYRKAKRILKAIANIIVLLYKKGRREDTVST